MNRRTWTATEESKILRMLEDGFSPEDVASDLGRSLESVTSKIRRLKDGGDIVRTVHNNQVSVQSVPSAGRPLPDLIKSSADAFRRKRDHHQAKKDGLRITIEDPKSFGILFFGDPHFGDPGTDVELFAHHAELCNETPGLYAFNMGDLSNNWVGSLQRLYGYQEATADEERELVRHLLKLCPWLCVVLGNHDKWSPVAEMLCREENVPYVSHGSKFVIQAGDCEFRVDARHKRKGFSMYNASHAELRPIFRGNDSHVVIGAHIHQWAETIVPNPETGHTGYAVQVGSYKRFDEYADSNDLQGDNSCPAVLVTVDTRKPSGQTVSFVKTHWCIDSGVEYLGWLRK